MRFLNFTYLSFQNTLQLQEILNNFPLINDRDYTLLISFHAIFIEPGTGVHMHRSLSKIHIIEPMSGVSYIISLFEHILEISINHSYQYLDTYNFYIRYSFVEKSRIVKPDQKILVKGLISSNAAPFYNGSINFNFSCYDIETWNSVHSIIYQTIPIDKDLWAIIFPSIPFSQDNCIVKVTSGLYQRKNVTFVIKQYSFNNLRTIHLKPHRFDLNIYIFDIFEGDNMVRSIDNNKYYFKNHNLTQHTTLINKLTKLKPKGHVIFTNKNILTLDIECLNIDGALHPYAVGIYDGLNFKYEYGKDCIAKILPKIFIRKYKGYTIYIHNLNFDFIYLIREIENLGYEIDIIPSNNGITFAEVKFKTPSTKEVFKIHFHDSYRILPSSLDKLSKTYNVSVKKGIFPHSFMDSWDKIDYIGITPSLKYYPKSSQEWDYTITDNWSARIESIKYLERDCKSLFDIMEIFSSYITQSYNISVTECPTLPSIAFSVFRANFYDADKYPIYNLKGAVDKFIRQSYFGGEVNVYSPRGKDLYYYDVNSLYPYSMMKPMPIGLPTHVRGSIDLDNFFGFIKAKVISPSKLNMKIPLLPCHINKYLTCPVGEWVGVYFSEELKKARDIGYKIEPLEGYSFEKGYPFNSYIEKFYDIKSNTNCETKRSIAKLMLNSLYGRMGMNEKYTKVKSVSDQELLNLLKNNNSVSPLFYNDLPLYKIENDEATMYDVSFTFSNIALASAITSYSRIHMYDYKNIPGNQCFYSDTDSVFLQYPLDHNVSNELGDMKLEYKVSEGIFISPKTYLCIKYNGEVISKVKGYQDNLTKEDFEVLLTKDGVIEKFQNKFLINKVDMGYNILPCPYSVKRTDNKRIPIFNDSGIFIDTEPIEIKNPTSKL